MANTNLYQLEKIYLLLECKYLLEVYYEKAKNELATSFNVLGTREIKPIINKKLWKNIEKISMIKDSLYRLDHGMYGNCLDCKRQIWEQLRIIPYAKYCPDCFCNHAQIMHAENLLHHSIKAVAT